jgi:hypothetical protein
MSSCVSPPCRARSRASPRHCRRAARCAPPRSRTESAGAGRNGRRSAEIGFSSRCDGYSATSSSIGKSANSVIRLRRDQMRRLVHGRARAVDVPEAADIGMHLETLKGMPCSRASWPWRDPSGRRRSARSCPGCGAFLRRPASLCVMSPPRTHPRPAPHATIERSLKITQAGFHDRHETAPAKTQTRAITAFAGNARAHSRCGGAAVRARRLRGHIDARHRGGGGRAGGAGQFPRRREGSAFRDHRRAARRDAGAAGLDALEAAKAEWQAARSARPCSTASSAPISIWPRPAGRNGQPMRG